MNRLLHSMWLILVGLVLGMVCLASPASAAALSAGESHNLGVRGDGSLVAWGYNYYGQCSIPAGLGKVASVSAGFSHSVALKPDGTVAAWGRNYEGQLNIP